MEGPTLEDKDICLADCATTHTILRDKKYFSYLIMQKTNINTILGSTNLIEGSGRANILLLGGTKLYINDALYSEKSQRNLLSFKDICINGYHIETTSIDNIEYLCITNIMLGKKTVLERLPTYSSGLYYTKISTIEVHTIINQKFNENFIVDRKSVV